MNYTIKKQKILKLRDFNFYIKNFLINGKRKFIWDRNRTEHELEYIYKYRRFS